MCPSVKLVTIDKLVRFFSKRLTASIKNTINLCLEFFHFGVSSTLISFDGDYCEYHGGGEREK